jgi:hypothetical protein
LLLLLVAVISPPFPLQCSMTQSCRLLRSVISCAFHPSMAHASLLCCHACLLWCHTRSWGYPEAVRHSLESHMRVLQLPRWDACTLSSRGGVPPEETHAYIAGCCLRDLLIRTAMCVAHMSVVHATLQLLQRCWRRAPSRGICCASLRGGPSGPGLSPCGTSAGSAGHQHKGTLNRHGPGLLPCGTSAGSAGHQHKGTLNRHGPGLLPCGTSAGSAGHQHKGTLNRHGPGLLPCGISAGSAGHQHKGTLNRHGPGLLPCGTSAGSAIS